MCEPGHLSAFWSHDILSVPDGKHLMGCNTQIQSFETTESLNFHKYHVVAMRLKTWEESSKNFQLQV